MSNAWIQTASGIQFDILNPSWTMFTIRDIAHSTSQANRFTGHCKFPYPVAQHEFLGSFLTPSACYCTNPREHAFRFLLHDASEGYIGDMSRPLKHFTTAGEEYRKVEHPIQSIIYARFGLTPDEPSCIKEIDTQMLYAEKHQLMGNSKFAVKWSDDERAADVLIRERTFTQNRLLYLSRFNKLCRPEDRYVFTLGEHIRLLWYKLTRKTNAVSRSGAAYH